MSKSSNVYVFEKKEVLLLFIFMILISLTSFLLGMKLGKNYSLEKQGITTSDKEKIEMHSATEEQIKAAPGANTNVTKDEKFDESFQKLQNEFNKLPKDNKAAETASSEAGKVAPAPKAAEQDKSVISKESYVGKYTIQLSSHRSVNEAESFAEGFRVRGYNPIINEVKIKGQGGWYRVSLGVFDTLEEAKEYIVQEKSLFKDQDYVIGRFE